MRYLAVIAMSCVMWSGLNAPTLAHLQFLRSVTGDTSPVAIHLRKEDSMLTPLKAIRLAERHGSVPPNEQLEQQPRERISGSGLLTGDTQRKANTGTRRTGGSR